MTEEQWKNKLYFGDNLEILRDHIADRSVDLIYLDPPFNSNATYNVLFKEASGEESTSQITAFEDTWHWGIEAEGTYHDVVTSGPEELSELLQAMRAFLGQNDMMAYLTMMAARLAELRRVLKLTGSIYLHCDPTASHYLKLLMDAAFGARNFKNEIIWKRTGSHGGAKRWGPIHDVILFYSGGNRHKWNRTFQEYTPDYIRDYYKYEDERGKYRLVTLTGPGTRQGDSGREWRAVNPTESGRHWAVPSSSLQSAYPHRTDLDDLTTQEKLELLDEAGLVYWPPRGKVPQQKRYLDEGEGVAIQDMVNDIRPLGSQDRERLGFDTQKPEALLERIIRASSDEGEFILDPFCGCGTAVAVAERLKRKWIGIDITHLAIALMKSRLRDAFKGDLSTYEVIGVPRDLASAEALAHESDHDGRYQFQYWGLGLVEARPSRESKKGADLGVDGYINFFDDNSGKAKRIIVQVTSGDVQRNDIATLKGDMTREKAVIGLFVTLRKPTQPMTQEAAAAGFYVPERYPNRRYPRVQILTIEELLDGAHPDYPRLAPPATFQRARRRSQPEGTQPQLRN